MMGDRLRQRRLAVGMSLQQVADALLAAGTQITRATLSKYELEQSSPNALVLREIAKVFGVRADYFLSETPTEVEWFAYRKRSSLSQADQAKLQSTAKEALERRVKAEELCGVAPKGVGEQNREQCESPDQAEDLAMLLRDRWGLGRQPIGSLIDLLEFKGFVMIPLATGELKFDGLSGLLNGVRPVIIYKDDVVTDRLRFTVAHELAHHFLRADDPKNEEKLAHRFAAAFLLPGQRLREQLGASRTRLRLEELILLKEQYGLSIQALVYRACDLGIISEGARTELFQFFGRMGMRRAEPGRYRVTEKPDELRRILLKGVAENQITEAQAAELDPEFPVEKERSQTMPTWDVRELLAFPTEERNKVLEEAAVKALALYQPGGPLDDLEVLDTQ